jgi:hypothetical protein
MSEITQETAQDVTQTNFVMADAQGRIYMSASMPRYMVDLQLLPTGGSLVLGTGSFDTEYVSDGQILPRPANSATLDGMTLRNLPSPCTITLEGQTHDCTDDHCELSFSHPGTFTVKVSAWPMLEAVFEVTQA